ncbi:MAG: SusC/RagA family TonB-linked outer membrane protein [Prevotellaceae bacterium]|jgi:TonB-linked SusC/RagA family outer membrane protein|nr:SusC/RagA family TonB-linked outer membrane protein [Prevotellaceae bacterium]
MKKFLIFFTVCLLFSVSASAQTKTVTGTVIGGDDKAGIPGATVLVNETKKGIAADIDGKYSIQVEKGQTLIFSAIGYEERSIVVGDDNQINVTLSVGTTVLSEAVVVGYGVQRKENLTGAVASVNVEKTLASRPIADVGRGLQGAVPGLTIRVPSGEVGSDPMIRIRGYTNSPNGQKDNPLILVDNVEIPSIQMLNTADIESISVLKDAASASIYGSKAAAGVILITTKKGAKSESLTVTLDSNIGWENPTKRIEMGGIDALEYSLLAAERVGSTSTGLYWKIDRTSFEKSKEWLAKYGGTVKATDPMVYNRDWYMSGSNMMGVRIYDPYESMVREWAPSTNNSLSVDGRSGKASYHLGIGYVRQTGMLKPAKKDDFTRYNLNLNISTEINKFITVRGGVMYSDRNKRYPAVDATVADPWYYLYRWSPVWPVGVQERGQEMRGPYNEIKNTITSNQQHTYYSVNLGATVNFTKDWDFRIDYNHYVENRSYNFAIPKFTALDSWGTVAVPAIWTDANGDAIYVDDDGNPVEDGGVIAYRLQEITYNPPGGTNPEPYIRKTRRETYDNTFNAYSNYRLKLGSEQQHKFDLMLGTSVHTNDWNEMIVSKSNLADFENPQFNFAYADYPGLTSSANWSAEVGFFGRLKYAFNDKYLVEFNLRHDGASVFPKNLKWNWYPSFSAGWVITNENFMENIKSVLNFAKLRASWGSLGDASISNSVYVPTLSYSQSYWMYSDGVRYNVYGTPGTVDNTVTWQSIESLDLGLELRFLKDKLGLTFDWFQKYTRDMIIGADTRTYTFGTAVPLGNHGEMRTRGWELAVDFHHRFENGLNISATASLADATGVCIKGADYLTPWGDRVISSNWVTGARYGDIWGYVTDRLYQKDDFVYNDDGTIKQIVIIIDGVPRTTNMLAGNNPNYQARLEAGRFVFGPGDVKYIDLNGDGYITPGSGTFGDPGDRKVIGNSTPRYEYGFTLNADWKGFDLSIFIQGVGSRDMVGDGNLVVPGYNTSEGAMSQAIAGNFWKEDRTDAFYPRPWNLGGTAAANVNSFNYQIQTRFLLNMAYTRIKNITLGYTLPNQIVKKLLINRARFYISLENFFTFDHLNGLPVDVEEVSGYSMFNTTNYNYNRTGMGTPTYKTVSVGINLTF